MNFLENNDDNLICAFKADSMHLKMYYEGGPLMGFELLIDDNILFQGKDYKPSPMHNVDSIESVVNLLGFLTVQPGGAEVEYFANYTAQQLEWANSFDCEVLGALVSDFEAGEPEYQKEAREYFEKGFTR